MSQTQLVGKYYDPETGSLACANDPSTALTSTHPKTNSWTHAVKSSGVMWFGESSSGTTSPLEFDASHTGMVKTVMMVVVCDSSEQLRTVLSAPVPLRFVAGEPDDWFAPQDNDGAGELSESFLGINSEVSVNGKPTNLMRPALKAQLVRVIFEDETALSRIYVGGVAGSPRWRRAWNGGVAEMLFFPWELDANQTACISKYFSAKYKLGLPPEPVEDLMRTLANLRIRHDGVFATMAIVR